MRAEDVPIHFGQNTITVAVTAMLLGASEVFAGAEDNHMLGQLFAIYMGRRLNCQLSGSEMSPAGFSDFVADAKGVVPDSTLARFAAVDLNLLDTWYGHLLGLAADSTVDLAELSRALNSIAAISGYFSQQVRRSR